MVWLGLFMWTQIKIRLKFPVADWTCYQHLTSVDQNLDWTDRARSLVRTWTNANSQSPEVLAHKISFLGPVVLSDVLHAYCRHGSRKPYRLWPPSKQAVLRIPADSSKPGHMSLMSIWRMIKLQEGWLQASLWKRSLRDKYSSKTTFWMSEALSNSLLSSCGFKDPMALFTLVCRVILRLC